MYSASYRNFIGLLTEFEDAVRREQTAKDRGENTQFQTRVLKQSRDELCAFVVKHWDDEQIAPP